MGQLSIKVYVVDHPNSSIVLQTYQVKCGVKRLFVTRAFIHNTRHSFTWKGGWGCRGIKVCVGMKLTYQHPTDSYIPHCFEVNGGHPFHGKLINSLDGTSGYKKSV